MRVWLVDVDGIVITSVTAEEAPVVADGDRLTYVGPTVVAVALAVTVAVTVGGDATDGHGPDK